MLKFSNNEPNNKIYIPYTQVVYNHYILKSILFILHNIITYIIYNITKNSEVNKILYIYFSVDKTIIKL